jgi:hypothetical protein
MSAEHVDSSHEGEIVKVAVPYRVDERILDQRAEVVELADQPAAMRHSCSVCLHSRIQVCLVHQAMEVDDEVSRRVQLVFNKAGAYEARKPGPAMAAIDLDDCVTRLQILFTHDRLHRTLCMGKSSSRLDGALLVDGRRPGQSKLDQCAVPAYVELEWPARIGIRRTERWEPVRPRHFAKIENQLDPSRAAGTALVVSCHVGATLPGAAIIAGTPNGPCRTTGGG